MSKNIAVLNENNYVENIIVVSDDFQTNEKFVEYNENNYACINGDYYNGKFYPPKKFPSWIRDEINYVWKAPVAYPTDDKKYSWNEDTQSWVEISEE